VKGGNYLEISGAGEATNGIQGSSLSATGVLFTNSWVKLAAVTDGTSSTVAYSESLRGPGSAGNYEVAVGTSTDVKHFMNDAGTGGSCNAPVAQAAIRMLSWFSGDFISGALGNAALPPNSKTMDCTFESPAAAWKTARSNHPGGVNAAFVDGHVAFVKDSVNTLTWRALGTRSGGEVVSADSV